jgi:hypothetical protein
MPKKRSPEGEYRIAGSVLDELGLDRQGALELKLKASLHQKILEFGKAPQIQGSRFGTNPTNTATASERIDARQAFHVERGSAAPVCRSSWG